MRVLIVTPPLIGHVTPLVALAAALTTAGHAVAWVGHPALLRAVVPPDAEIFPAGIGGADDTVLRHAGAGLRGVAAYRFLWEDFLVPLAEEMLPAVDAAIVSVRPDVIVADHQAFAGALAARRAGIPWVTSASTSASLLDPFDTLPQLRAWQHAQIAGLLDRIGHPFDPLGLVSPHRVVAWTGPRLVGDAALPPRTALVGPAIAPRRPVDFPWELLASRPRVLISLGTINADMGDRFFALAVQAAVSAGAQPILVADPARCPPVADAIVAPFVPQLDLLRRVDAVVGHGGHNTVVEALSHGLPMVLAPIRDDQPIIADQVVRAGAGVRVKFGRVGVGDLTEALTRALGDPELRRGAQAVAADFAACGGPMAAADHVAALTGSQRSA